MRKQWDVNFNECYEYIMKEADKGKTKLEAVAEYSERSGIPNHIVRAAYYRERNRRLMRGEAVDGYLPRRLEEDIEQDPLVVLTEVIALGEQSGIDVALVLAGLLPLFRAAAREVEYREWEAEAENCTLERDKHKERAEQLARNLAADRTTDRYSG